MPKIVVANYSTSTHFKIPKGIDLDDETQVESWGTKWCVLYIYFVDKTKEPLEIEAEFEPELDCKYANSETIEDGYAYEFNDDEEEEEDDEPAKISKTVVADIIAKVVM